jgi:hypothetical protein
MVSLLESQVPQATLLPHRIGHPQWQGPFLFVLSFQTLSGMTDNTLAAAVGFLFSCITPCQQRLPMTIEKPNRIGFS